MTFYIKILFRPTVLPQIDHSKIKQCVFGPNHIAFLMDVSCHVK